MVNSKITAFHVETYKKSVLCLPLNYGNIFLIMINFETMELTYIHRLMKCLCGFVLVYYKAEIW